MTEVRAADDAAHILRSHRLVGLSPRPIDLLPLLRLKCVAELWTCEAPDSGWIERFDIESFSLEGKLRVRDRWRTSNLDDLLPYLPDLASEPAFRRVLVPYGVTDRWRSIVARPSSRVFVPQPLADKPKPELADKIAMRRWLRGLGVPLPISAVVSHSDLNYQRLAKKLGSPFVIQTPAGSAGIGTYLIDVPSDIAHARAEHPWVGWWLASRYAGDTTLNFHGLVTSRGHIAVTRPSVQLANLTLAGSGFGEYCGSDFLSPRIQPDSVHRACRLFTERIGASLAELGHVGVFGVDFAVQGDTAVALEVNNRIQASTWLLGELELQDRQVPTLCRHVLEAMGCPTASDEGRSSSAGVQLVIRHIGPAGHLTTAPRPGAYTHGRDGLRRRGKGVGLLDCRTGEVILTDIPRPGTFVRPGAVLARMIARMSIASPNGQTLTPEGVALLDAIRRLCLISTQQ